MKRILLLLLSLFAVTAAHAQQKVTLKQCQGDTVAYVKKNFEEGKARFIGQPFSKVVKEWKMQIPISRILLSGTDPWANNEKLRNLVNGVDLFFTPERTINYRSFYHIPYYGVTIIFEPPYQQKLQELYDIQNQTDQVLSPRLYDKLKDYVVKDIIVFEMK